MSPQCPLLPEREARHLAREVNLNAVERVALNDLA